MVRTRKRFKSRKDTNFLEKRDSTCSSPDSYDSSWDPKSSDGESSSSSSSSRLGGSDMGTSFEQHKSLLLDIEENGGDKLGRKMDEANECNASSRETEDMPNQSITEKGESWWNEILVSKNMSRELAKECLTGVACASWMGYIDGFTELERINIKESEKEEQSINLDTSLKTGLERSNVVIQFLRKESLICPATAVKELWDRVKIHIPYSKKQLLSSSTYDPMKAGAIRKEASEMMKNARIPSNYSPYTLKHASISALTIAGTPVEQVAKFARLSV
ncbi:uncharacterized protein MONOS_5574c2 [Monocercomonoides exilis]|uniref:uncharacterized protein n=1 Tax=Monocercomonoides exilis TaxID=2049356 RepID=UPI00355ABE29|nr:hypothetical protein MONOS_5574c1 [Monocercomonoides exilis]KAH7823676.1 hypothetical protein MONOS_5574c2 [Monocercomonoides exilis]|eukprot:MONOS_5574.1-p1 / transcript=MONOS_5574.1 / gene=MONOS_5574 / organism=Monocercomonoides_exilis_PA203 / gene_product=unspecified product / transcript_product=unspecified product / location=Mono_scaffold00164:22373-23589(+) / protein_length=276 / sequence_SO=supercontig / SO=protein_coding / is_pseudo=false